MLRISSQ